MQIDVQTLHQIVRDEGGLHVFGAVYEGIVANPDAYVRAEGQGELRAYLTGLVRAACRKNPDARVMPQVFTDPTRSELHAADARFSTGDPDAALLAPRILEEARAGASEKMATYLGWLRDSHRGVSDTELAAAEGIEAVTVRGGRKRAVDFLLEVAHRMRHPAMRVDAELPEPLAQIAARLTDGDAVTARQLLADAEPEFGADPRWWNLSGVRAWRCSEWDEAVRCYREALVLADVPRLRAKILNNLGTIELSRDRLDKAQALFLRASNLAENGVPVWLNLLAVASLRRDVHDCRFYATRLVATLRGRDRAGDRAYAAERLRSNPNYAWVRKTSAWATIARWLRSVQARPALPRALAVASLVLACVLLFACGHVDDDLTIAEAQNGLARVDETSEDPDGDVWVRPKDPDVVDLAWLVERDQQRSDWSGADLSGMDLSDVDLTGADLRATVLWGADLRGAVLAGADLTGADLSDVDWGNTTCPDGSNSDQHGSCLGHLKLRSLVVASALSR